jgi:hypothetical protein
MNQLEIAISATLQSWRQDPFTWEDANCGKRLGDYARRLTGFDPAAHWRGFRCGAEKTLEEVHARGDIILADVRGHEASGLYLGDGKAAYSLESGVLTTSGGAVLASWRWPL